MVGTDVGMARLFGMTLLVALSVLAGAGVALGQGNPLDGDGPAAAPRLPIYAEGDGLAMSIETLDRATATLTGRLMLGAKVFEYRGAYENENLFRGKFAAGGQEFDFTMAEDATGTAIFKTGEATYRLKQVAVPSRPFPPRSPDTGTPLPLPPPPAKSELAGEWSGTLEEKAADGTSAKFPLRLSVTAGGSGGYTADLLVRMKARGQDGVEHPIKVTAKFTGTMQNGRLQMRSSDAMALLEDTNQTFPMGAQELSAQVTGNRMTGQVGNQQDGFSTISLAKQATGTPNFTGPAPAAPAAGTVRFTRASLRDPEIGNLESHRLLVPEGWSVQGGAVWTPQIFRSFNHLNLRVTAPDGREVSVYPGTFYSYKQSDIVAPPRPGTIDAGTVVLPIPASIDDYVTRTFMPYHRPQAANIRVIGRAERPEVARRINAELEPLITLARQNDAQQGTRTSFGTIAIIVRISYEEGGRTWEEDLYFDGFTWQTHAQDPTFGKSTDSGWTIEDVQGVRAVAGSLAAAKPLLDCIRLSIRRTVPYSSLLAEIHTRILRQRSKAVKEAAALWQKHQDQIVKNHRQSVSSEAAARDKSQRDFINTINEVDEVVTGDGGRVAVPTIYDNVYENADGVIIATTDPLIDTTGLKKLPRAR